MAWDLNMPILGYELPILGFSDVHLGIWQKVDGHTAHHNSRAKAEPYPGSRPVGAFPVSLQRLSRDVRHEALHCSADNSGGQRSGADCTLEMQNFPKK